LFKKTYELPAYLIGQLGKNDLHALDISGNEIIDLALDIIIEAYKLVGGRFVLVECHEHPKLIEFYQENHFNFLQRDEEFVQLVRFLK